LLEGYRPKVYYRSIKNKNKADVYAIALIRLLAIIKNMKLSAKAWWEIFVETLKNLIKKNFLINCASVSFYTIFSLPGITIITIMIVNGFLGEDELEKSELLNQLTWLLGDASYQEIEHMLYNPASTNKSQFMKILGAIIAIGAATTVVIVIKESLNELWQVRSKPKKVLKHFLIDRFISLQFLTSIGLIFIVTLSMDNLLTVLKIEVDILLNDNFLYLTNVLKLIFSTGIELIVFAAIFKILPDVEIKWKDVWIGALLTTIIFALSKNLITIYIDHSKYNEAYGAAGSLVGMLSWVYFSAMILFFGAQFTVAYNHYIGRVIGPNKNAVAIKEVEISSHIEP
jgi:membrane protein